MPFLGCSKLVIGEGSHGSYPQSCPARPRVTDIRGALSMQFVLYFIFVQFYLQKYLIFVLFLDILIVLQFNMSITHDIVFTKRQMLSSSVVLIIGKLLHFNILLSNMITDLKNQY